MYTTSYIYDTHQNKRKKEKERKKKREREKESLSNLLHLIIKKLCETDLFIE